MSFSKIIVILMLSICIADLSPADSSQMHKALSLDVFNVLFYGLDLNKTIKDDPPQFLVSSEGDILAFLNHFPVESSKISNVLSYRKKYRLIQADYGKYSIVFLLGNELNKWNKKLYQIAFNISLPNKEVPEDETRVYKKIVELHGDFTKTEKLRYSDNTFDENINVYIWRLDGITVTYRSLFDSENRRTVIVVEYWDHEFLKVHNYWEY